MSYPNEDRLSNSARESSSERTDAARTLGELLACATAYERRAGPPTDPDEWFSAQSQSLLQWANDCGRLLSASEFSALIAGFKELEGGLEHQVFWKKRAGRLFKITKPPYFGVNWDLKMYVQNVIWCNAFFEDDMRLEGVLETPSGVSLVMSQPFILGKSPTLEQIVEWFKMQGCTRRATLIWEYPDGTVAADAHTGNLIMREDGSLFPIDLHLERMGPAALALLESTSARVESSGACSLGFD